MNHSLKSQEHPLGFLEDHDGDKGQTEYVLTSQVTEKLYDSSVQTMKNINNSSECPGVRNVLLASLEDEMRNREDEVLPEQLVL